MKPISAIGLGAASLALFGAVGIAQAETDPVEIGITGGTLVGSTTAPTFAATPYSFQNALATNNAGGSFAVADTRGSDAGWSITVAVDDFVGNVPDTAADLIPAANLAVVGDATDLVYTNGGTGDTASDGSASKAAITTDGITNGSVGTGLKILSAGAGEGMGDYAYTPSFELTVPAKTLAGTYTSTLTTTYGTAP